MPTTYVHVYKWLDLVVRKGKDFGCVNPAATSRGWLIETCNGGYHIVATLKTALVALPGEGEGGKEGEREGGEEEGREGGRKRNPKRAFTSPRVWKTPSMLCQYHYPPPHLSLQPHFSLSSPTKYCLYYWSLALKITCWRYNTQLLRTYNHHTHSHTHTATTHHPHLVVFLGTRERGGSRHVMW